MDIIGVNIPIEDAIGNITRIAKLEDLCRDMYATIDNYCVTVADRDRYFARMEQLGLLEEK